MSMFKGSGGMQQEGDQLVGLDRMKWMQSMSPVVSDSSRSESIELLV